MKELWKVSKKTSFLICLFSSRWFQFFLSRLNINLKEQFLPQLNGLISMETLFYLETLTGSALASAFS